ncbi:MAG TPA: hypothetical protein VHC43_05190 [Mycobacteriales bacterium]|nr:hypothetical protein [Mycobacteriales bacterium]
MQLTTGRLLGATVLTAALVIGVSGCSGLEFQQDRRLSFTSPASDQLTKLPVTLAWTMKAPVGAYRFGVFVDQQPIKVGRNVDSVLPSGTRPTRALFAAADVYVTSASSLTLRNIPDLDNDRSSRQRHWATVVLLDRSGNRVNESAWTRSFDLPRNSS